MFHAHRNNAHKQPHTQTYEHTKKKHNRKSCFHCKLSLPMNWIIKHKNRKHKTQVCTRKHTEIRTQVHTPPNTQTHTYTNALTRCHTREPCPATRNTEHFSISSGLCGPSHSNAPSMCWSHPKDEVWFFQASQQQCLACRASS
jgi:hypothetical protein